VSKNEIDKLQKERARTQFAIKQLLGGEMRDLQDRLASINDLLELAQLNRQKYLERLQRAKTKRV
jgi:predicted nuclease with TOPRIM domain